VLKAELDQNWGFLLRDEIAPVWLSEFGTAGGGVWWSNLMRYVHHVRAKARARASGGTTS
jgi:hypothetical protein